MSNTMIRSGTVLGTGATLNVPLGFAPDYVKVINFTDGESIEWTREMIEDGSPKYGIKEVAAGTKSVLATAAVGIDDYAGLESDGSTLGIAKGFTIGATAGVNIAAEDIMWVAHFTDGP